MGVLICSQATQPNTKHEIFGHFGFPFGSSLYRRISTTKFGRCHCCQCLESFDKFEFVNVYNCADECKNCNLCEGSSLSVCQYCVQDESCTDLCKEGKEKCCALPEASGLCKDNFP